MLVQSWEQSVQECGLLVPGYPHFLPVMPLGWEQGLRVRSGHCCSWLAELAGGGCAFRCR